MSNDTAAVLATNPRSDLVEKGGVMFVREASGLVKLAAQPSVIRAVLRGAEGTRAARAASAVSEGCGQAEALAAVDELTQAGVLFLLEARQLADAGARVEVIGRGALAKAIAARLREVGIAAALGDGPLPSRGAATVVWAREGARLAEALSANEACLREGTSVLFAVAQGGEVAMGPLVVPGRTACLACVLGEGAEGATSGDCPAPLVPLVAEQVASSLSGAERPQASAPAVLRERQIRSAFGGARDEAAWPRPGCSACAAAKIKPGPYDTAAGLALRASPRATATWASQPGGKRLRVGVIGGGTAGYLTALALERHRPDVAVTLIESSSIPVIGVGEATTPEMVEFLLGTLGIDELELYREVKPTWKLGIRFFWGEPGPSAFNHPFTGEHLLEAMALAGDQDMQSLSAQLMTRRLSPVLREPDGTLVPLLSTTPYAYHLDNARFVRFLHKLADRRGIERHDCVIEHAALAADGSIDHLRSRDGRTFSFDLYIDASGFSSLLLHKTLGVPFESYSKTLFCDTAVVAEVPHDGDIIPYTLAETMDSGWCWNIPTPEENHRGYVFSSAFATPEAAEAEMRAKNPRMGEARLVRFRSGRYEACWRKNVLAVGNSYAFVEPLESTALYMLIDQVKHLLVTLPSEPSDFAAPAARVSESIARHWDTLRGFLALHHRFNRKLDTPFWRASRSDVALCEGETMLAAFQERAPLTARPDRQLIQDSLVGERFFGLLGVDNVLFGQKVQTRLLGVGGSAAPFERWARHGVPSLISRALTHREGLESYVRWLSERRGG